jgi:hypothetical protein
MPAAATGFADLLAADPQPFVRGGVFDHPLDQLAVGLFGLGDISQRGANLGEAACQRVAHGLQLGDAEQAGATGGADAPLDPLAGEGRAEQPSELGFHAGDLAAQICAGGAYGSRAGLTHARLEGRQDLAAAPRDSYSRAQVELLRLGPLHGRQSTPALRWRQPTGPPPGRCRAPP